MLSSLRWSSLVCLAVVAALDPSASGDGCGSCGGSDTPIDTKAVHVVSVYPVRLADNDGSNAATVSADSFAESMASATEIFQRGGVNITFVTDKDADFDSHVKNTLLNHDCFPRTATPQAFTKEDLNNDGEVDDADANLICDKAIVSKARAAYALKYPDKLVIFHRWAKDKARYDKAAGHWVIDYAKVTGGFSGRASYFVAGVPGGGGSTFLAHEMGHYLHLAHTHGTTATDVADAASKVKKYLDDRWDDSSFVPARDGLMLFDGDLRDDVTDTPPDASSTIFSVTYPDRCALENPTVFIPVNTHGQTFTFELTPMRNNVMSYFKGCPFPMTITPQQSFRVYASLQQLNRVRLLHPELVSCYKNKNIVGSVNEKSTNTEVYEEAIARREGIIDDCLDTLEETSANGAARSSRTRLHYLAEPTVECE